MKLTQLEFRHFNYFLTLAKALNFRIASEQLFISQSALSQQILRLESILETKLFQRTNRKVTLTQAGELFVQMAEEMVFQRDRSLEKWKMAVSGVKGLIKIGFVGSAMNSYLPPVLKRFTSNYPDIKFQLEELSNRDQLKMLENQQIDIGFMRSNRISPALAIQSVYKENFSLVLPKGHWISEENFTGVEQLSKESFILYPNEHSQMYYQQILNICSDAGFSPQISHRSIHGPTIFKLIESGLGVSIVPISLRDDHNYHIKFIELKEVIQKTELFAVWNRANRAEELFHFIQQLGQGSRA